MIKQCNVSAVGDMVIIMSANIYLGLFYYLVLNLLCTSYLRVYNS